MDDKKLTGKQYFVVASLIFALFFGAGNLIFPLHLGQLAGHNWPAAAVGFLVTGVILPLLSLLAIAITRSKGVYDIGLPLGTSFALIFMTLIHLTIGPFFGTPRTATISFSVGVAPLLPAQYQKIGLFIFSLVFFLIAFLISYKESDILSTLGKVLNPVFLILLFLVFLFAFANPLGNPADMPATQAYQSNAFVNGFLEGYNTMDALAGLAFGVTVVTAIRTMGVKKDSKVAMVTAKSGVLAILAIALIYVLLIVIGAMSLGKFKIGADGGVTFSQIVNHYAGIGGQAFLAVLITLTCLTTAVGLVAAFAQDFHKHFPKLGYHAWLTISCGASFITANFGLEQIINWSTPVLMFLYPLSMVLIILSVLSPYIKRDHVVYKITILLTLIPAFLDLIVNLPAPVANTSFVKAVAAFRMQYLPLANIGISWLVPALIGIVVSLVIHAWRRKTARI